MERPVVLLAVSAGIALAWIPLFVRHARAWLHRGQLANLCLTALTLFALYVPTYLAVSLPPSWPLAAVTVVDGLVCGFFLLATWLTVWRPARSRRTVL
jgi:hypothetical protein